MDLIISKSDPLEGSVDIPSSKSQTLRAIYRASLTKGVSLIQNALDSDDVKSMINVMQEFGVRIVKKQKDLVVFSPGLKSLKAPRICYVRDSGIVLRFISSFAAIFRTKVIFTGSSSLIKQRSISDCEWALNQLSVKTVSSNGFCPFSIQGPVRRSVVWLSGSDSQPVSSLLWLLSLSKKKQRLFVLKPKELPWVQLTLFWLTSLNKNVFLNTPNQYLLSRAIRLKPFIYKVPKDFSSLSFILAAGLLSGNGIHIKDLDFRDPQGDKAIIFLLKQMKCDIILGESELKIKKAESLHFQELDVDPFIDALPVLSVLALLSKSQVILKNAAGARGKESDRIQSMMMNLKACGIEATSTQDQFMIRPGNVRGGICESFSDHRIAMASALLGLISQEPVRVKNIESINKTYPEFIDHLKILGANLRIEI